MVARPGAQFLDGPTFVAKYEITLDEVRQLAQVSGPGISLALLQQMGRQAQRTAGIAFRESSHEMAQKRGNLFLAIAQRWDFDGECVETVVQIFPQLLSGDCLLHVNIGSS